ncbi:acyl-CoA dehydrogenase family protein [Planococcus salinus]|uniref:DNA alkylation response protein n=1 Tax=Planococcus salinus TaxID=1848460 RepID=A0A3M8P6L8_9BACL|nr:acyl-CoA dehydrogenase family protein [Planococcus salinus]RNF38920.1 DNA alkylation response protein [Planococcus salinus]
METTLKKNEKTGNMPDTEGLNFFEEDKQLSYLLNRMLSEKEVEQAQAMLSELGGVAGGELDQLSRTADKNPPVLQSFNEKGERVDHVEFHPSYRQMERLGYGRFNMVAMSHKKEGIWGWDTRFPYVLKYASWYLFAQAEFGLLCPMSMTDSAARVLDKFASEEMKQKYLPRLTSTDLDELWTGAQFMTEKQGGSDVGANTMRAEKAGDYWKLWGDKWFCSNVSADVALVLARPDNSPSGTKGLGMFLVPRRLEDQSLNHYRINRLKDKLGTMSMASGEVSFEGAVAYEVGEINNGFKQMMAMVNSSRLSNAVRSTGMIRRSFVEALEHARGRASFGKDLAELPLMRENLFELLLDSETTTSMVLHTAGVYQRADEGEEKDQALLRILTPLLKGYICKRARYLTAESMEVRGGNGYIEDWVNPKLLRDAHVGSIWEGTTNILALDVLRSLSKDRVGAVFFDDLKERLAKLEQPAAKRLGQVMSAITDKVQQQTDRAVALEGPARELPAKQLMNRMYHLYAASLLLEEAEDEISTQQNYRKLYLAVQYISRYFLANGFDDFHSSDPSLLDAFNQLMDWGRVEEGAAETMLQQLESAVGI